MNKYKVFILTTLYIFTLNLILTIFLYKYISFLNICFYLFESITVSVIISLIALIFKKKEKVYKTVQIILLFILTVFFMAALVHYGFYDCFFSFRSFLGGGQVAAFIATIIKVMGENAISLLLIIALFVVTCILISKTKFEYNKKTPISLLIVFLINILVSTSIIYIPSNDIYSRKNLLKNTNMEFKNAESFGLITAFTIDVYRYFTGYNYSIKSIDNNSNTYDKNKYNIQEINFKKSKNKKINKLNNYFKNETPTEKNEYTGIFKDKNLIFITAESFSFDLINKDRTPTLYKLYNEGFRFNNFYTPIYYVSTSDGEYTNLTGLLPHDGTWSYIKSLDNYYPYTYGTLLNNKGYKSYSYHNGIYNFYNRNTVMPNFGYTFEGCGNGLEKRINCSIWPQSDEEMITNTFKDYKDDKKFNVYYMSISAHLHYDFKNDKMAIKHQNEVKDLNYHKTTNAYISASMDLEKALAILMDDLKKENLLDDTVIVLVPDHYPYGLSNKEYSDLRTIDYDYQKHKSGLIIYNSTIKGTEINKYASNIDILPTLLNMYGTNYDSRIIIGKDIMSQGDGIVIFNDRSFLTNKGFYNETTNKFIGNKVTNKYIKEKRELVYNKVNVSSLMLDTDYYKHIK